MRIGLDIDDVLADFNTHFLNYLDFEDKTPPKSWEDERFRTHIHKVLDDVDFYLSIPVKTNPEDFEFSPVCYVTARNIPLEVTQAWLNFYGFPKAPLFSVGVGNSKADILLENKVDIFVDDAIHNYHDLHAKGVKCVLFSTSHNLDFEVEHRIFDLNEINQYGKEKEER